VSHDRLPEEEPGYAEVTPNLVIETRSPSDRGPGVTSKIQEWLAAGVQMAIDLDPERRTLTVHRPGETPVVLGPDDTLDGYDVLPGFSLPLSRLFP
jgi:Uma2 family endonuclease